MEETTRTRIFRYGGKADPNYPGEPKWHPLVYHSLDVAAVAAVWWDSSAAIQRSFIAAFGTAAIRKSSYAGKVATVTFDGLLKVLEPKALVSHADVCGGRPRVKNTRLTVEFLLGLKAAGWSEQQILENYPSLKPEDLHAYMAMLRPLCRMNRFFLRRERKGSSRTRTLR
jgi:uncharacterized protein (DUF433 family)